MDFGERLLLCVGAAQATLGRWRAGRLVDCQSFSDDDDGLRRFSAALAAARNLQIHALVDAVEEDYRTELLPHTVGRDRAGMVQRRLRQLYRNSPYNAAVLQGRETDKRRDDRYLFAALTNAEVFLPWAEAIEDAKIPFAGLYLLPMVMPQLAERLGLTRGDELRLAHRFRAQRGDSSVAARATAALTGELPALPPIALGPLVFPPPDETA